MAYGRSLFRVHNAAGLISSKLNGLWRCLVALIFACGFYLPQMSSAQAQSDFRKGTVSPETSCSTEAIYVNTHSDNLTLLASVDFRRESSVRFKSMTEVVQSEEWSRPQGRVEVKVNPVVSPLVPMPYSMSSASSRDSPPRRLSESMRRPGPQDPQVFPVEVEISNTTARVYVLEVDKIVLLTSVGERVKAIGESDRAFPTPTLTNQTLAPGASVKGYLYYPAGSYTGARGFLIEEQSQTREGFAVEF
jgi:hypothetical protein